MAAGLQRVGEQVGFELLAPLRAFGDGFDFGRVEGAADHEAHSPVIADQSFDAARGQGQRHGLEIAGQAVVTDGALQCGDV